MNIKDNTINDENFKKFLQNDNYYKFIFKKTEKIVSVVFYVLNNIDIDKKSETHISNIASKAHFVHENALRTLAVKPASSKEVLEQFAQALVGLESTLHIAASSSVIAQDVLVVLVNEIEVVLRGLGGYMKYGESTEDVSFGSATSAPTISNRNQVRSAKARPQSVDSATESSGTQQSTSADRKQRIKTILEAKGEATIKDIAEIVTDCSEKTIQRELNTMIDENIVKREGERRWSKYSVI